MKKYVSIEDAEDMNLTMEETLLRAQEIVLVSDIEIALKMPNPLLQLKAIRNLITPEPIKYARLTVEGWGQLENLGYINIELLGDMGDRSHYFLEEFTKACKEHEEIEELLPDPKGKFWRYCNGKEDQPVPDNVIIEIEHTRVKVPAKAITWSNRFGYRVCGVAEDE